MLEKKVALVTGSTSGIGLAIAKYLIDKNCIVIINSILQKEDQNIRQLIKNLPNKEEVNYIAADITKPEEVKDLIKRIISKYKKLDVLINNAGIQYVAPIEDFPENKWDDIIGVNLSSSFYTIKYSLPYMKKNNWGRIINIASAHGIVASENKSAYVAAKHGLVGLTKVVALETAKDNITCNAICPGWVLTPLVQKQIEQKAKDNNITIEEAKFDLLKEKQPSLRFVETSEIANLVYFLCHNNSSQITGASISIDGGWTIK